MKRKALPILLAATFLTALLVPLADAHAAPDPREFEVRLLHDYSDDFPLGTTGGPGFDAIALDAREAYLDGEAALVLRLILNGGCPDGSPDCPELTHTIQFTANGTAHEYDVTSSDGGATFTGDAARYDGPRGINDGNRFAVDVWIPFAELGVSAGSVLSDWFVVGDIGGVPGDDMPEGLVPMQPEAEPVAFDIGEYAVRAPDYYLSLDAAVTSLELKPDATESVSLSISNLVDLEQEVTFNVSTDEGLTATLLDDGGTEVTTQALAPRFNGSLALDVQAAEGADGFVTVQAATGLGALETFRLPVKAHAETVDESFLQSPDILSGESWSHTFQTAGVFSYHNHHSPAIQGTITIQGAHDGMDDDSMSMEDDGMAMEAETHTVVFDGSVFEPAEMTISVGDTVVFQNDGEGMLMIMGGVSDDGSVDHDHMNHGDDGHDDHSGDHSDDTALIPSLSALLVLMAAIGLAFLVRRR